HTRFSRDWSSDVYSSDLQMTERARRIGLEKSTFVNATGLPANGQQTTVREMVLLARHLWKDYPDLYGYYGRKEFTWNKIRQLNRSEERRVGKEGGRRVAA